MPRPVELDVWNLIAFNALTRFQENKLPNSGIIRCPRSIILQFFDRTDFEYLYQEKNNSYYKLKG